MADETTTAAAAANQVAAGVAPVTASAAVSTESAAGKSRALVLFAHGARAAGWAAPFERLRDLVAARQPDVEVSLAFLELMSPRLPEKAAELVARGVASLTVVPVFLGQGGHVLRDLPVMIDQLRVEHPQLAVHVVEAAGENAAVLAAIADYCVGALGSGA